MVRQSVQNASSRLSQKGDDEFAVGSSFQDVLDRIIVDIQRRLTIAYQADLAHVNNRAESLEVALRQAEHRAQKLEAEKVLAGEFGELPSELSRDPEMCHVRNHLDNSVNGFVDDCIPRPPPYPNIVPSAKDAIDDVGSLNPVSASAGSAQLFKSRQQLHQRAIQGAVQADTLAVDGVSQGDWEVNEMSDSVTLGSASWSLHGSLATVTMPGGVKEERGRSNSKARHRSRSPHSPASLEEVKDEPDEPPPVTQQRSIRLQVNEVETSRRSKLGCLDEDMPVVRRHKSVPSERKSLSPAVLPGQQVRPELEEARDRRGPLRSDGLAVGSTRLSTDMHHACDGTFSILKVWSRSNHSGVNMSRKISMFHTESSSLRRDSSVMNKLIVPSLEGFADSSASQNPFLKIWSTCMIAPNSHSNICWECLGIALICYDLVSIPLLFMDMPRTDFGRVASWVIKVFWTLNVFVSFLSGYLDHRGVVVTNPPKVAVRYIQTWFFFDIGILIIDWCELIVRPDEDKDDIGVFQSLSGIRFLRLLRILRVLKLVRLGGMVVFNIRNERVILLGAIAKLMIFMAFLTHIICCLWYGVGRYGRSPSTSWVQYNQLDRESFTERYLMSFHCALAMFTGEHIVAPRNLLERGYMVAVLFLTLVISAWFVSSLTTAMTRLHIITSRRSSQFAALRRYLADHSISHDLAAKVFRNAQHVINEQKRNAPESNVELLQIISEPLKSELHFELYSPLLLVHPFFDCYKEFNLPGVTRICHHAMNRISFSSGDIVFSESECPAVPKMFVIQRGSLSYHQEQVQDAAIFVSTSNWLSEAVLWTEWIHQGTLVSASECQLLALDAMKFQSIVSKFPTSNVKVYAEEFVKMLGTTGKDELTDVGNVTPEVQWALHIAFPQQRQSHLGSIRSRSNRSHQASKAGSARERSGVKNSAMSVDTTNTVQSLYRSWISNRSSVMTFDSVKSITPVRIGLNCWWWLLDTRCVQNVINCFERLKHKLNGTPEFHSPIRVSTVAPTSPERDRRSQASQRISTKSNQRLSVKSHNNERLSTKS